MEVSAVKLTKKLESLVSLHHISAEYLPVETLSLDDLGHQGCYTDYNKVYYVHGAGISEFLAFIILLYSSFYKERGKQER